MPETYTRPCYRETWLAYEDEARAFKAEINEGKTVRVEFVPGDGTQYEFLFIPSPEMQMHITAHPEYWQHPSTPGRVGVVVGNPAFATGMAWLPWNGPVHAHDLESWGLTIRNPCTVAALLATIEALTGHLYDSEPEHGC